MSPAPGRVVGHRSNVPRGPWNEFGKIDKGRERRKKRNILQGTFAKIASAQNNAFMANDVAVDDFAIKGAASTNGAILMTRNAARNANR